MVSQRDHDLAELLVLLDILSQISKSPPKLITSETLEELKLQWQILLGIDEYLFKSDDYENISLEIHSRLGTFRFQCLKYLGTEDVIHINDDEIPSDILISMGDPLQSKSLIRVIEDSTTTNLNDITNNLTLINKIRNVLVEHESLVANVSKRQQLVELLNRSFRYEIKYNQRASLLLEVTTSDLLDDIENSLTPLQFETNNESFNNCYEHALLMLVTSLSRSDQTNELDLLHKLEKASNLVIDSFLKLNGISIIYDIRAISEFHLSIFNIAKASIHNNEHSQKDQVSSLIDEYFSMNPIIPILKPIIKQFTEQEQSEVEHPVPNDTEEILESELSNTTEIDEIKLTTILSHIIHSYIKSTKDNVPLPVRWFPQIFKTYLSILHEDSKDPNNDLFYNDTKRCILKYAAESISPQILSDDLYALSLMPSSEPFTYHGVSMPTVEMRYALYRTKVNIESKRRILSLWFDNATYSNTHKSLLNIWIKSRKQVYLKKWFNVLKSHETRNSKTDIVCDSLKSYTYLQQWKYKSDKYSRMSHEADLYFIEKFFIIWKANKNDLLQTLDSKHAQHELSFLAKKYLKVWQLAATARDIQPVITDATSIKRRGLELWKQSLKKKNGLEERAITFSNNRVKKNAFNCWVAKGQPGELGKLAMLQDVERTFASRKHLQLWTNGYNLKILEQETRRNNDLYLMKWMFQLWKSHSENEDSLKTFVRESNSKLLKKYFRIWSINQKMNSIADSFNAQRLAGKVLKQWKLSLKEAEVLSKRNNLLLRSKLNIWRLGTRNLALTQDLSLRASKKNFETWKNKMIRHKHTLIKSAKCRDAQSLRAFFTFWVARSKSIAELEAVSDEFHRKKESENNRDTVYECYNVWVNKMFDVLEKEKLLEDAYDNHTKSSSKIIRLFDNWKTKSLRIQNDSDDAIRFRELSLLTKASNSWIRKFDRVLELQQICDESVEVRNVEILTQLISQLLLKSMKVQTDNKNADLFKSRWDRNKLKTFFDIWQTNHQDKQNSVNNTLFDTFDADSPERITEPTTRLSPLAHRRNQLSILKMNSQVNLGTVPDLGTPIASSSSMFVSPTRTPLPNNRDPQAIPATERVRRMNLEQRKNQYRQVRRSPDVSPGKEGIGSTSTPIRRDTPRLRDPNFRVSLSPMTRIASNGLKHVLAAEADPENVFIQRTA